jgi:hypothetical protein
MRQCFLMAVVVCGLVGARPRSAHADLKTFDLTPKSNEASVGLRTELTSMDQERAKHYLRAIGDTGKAERVSDGVSFGSISGAYIAGALGFYLAYPSGKENRILGAMYGVVGVATLAVSLYYFLSPSDEEEIDSAFTLRVRATNLDWKTAVVDTNTKLGKLAAKRRAQRKLWGWLGAAFGALAAAAGVVSLASAAKAETKDQRVFGYGAGAFATGAGVGFCAIYILHAYQESPTERLVRLYREDPGLKIKPGNTPAGRGGIALGLSGRF